MNTYKLKKTFVKNSSGPNSIFTPSKKCSPHLSVVNRSVLWKLVQIIVEALGNTIIIGCMKNS